MKKKVALMLCLCTLLVQISSLTVMAANSNFAFVYSYNGEKFSQTKTKANDGDRLAYVTPKSSLTGYGSSTLFKNGGTAYFRMRTPAVNPANGTMASTLHTTKSFARGTMTYYSGYGIGNKQYMLTTECSGQSKSSTLVGVWCP